MKLDELIVDGEDLAFGNLYSSKFEVQVYGTVVIDGQTVSVGDIDFYGKRIFVFQEDDGVFKRLFTGKVDSAKKNKDGHDKTLVAYDTAYTYNAQNIAEWWATYWSSTALMYNQGSLDIAVAFYSDATSGVETYLNSIYAASSYNHRYALNIYNGKVFYANNNAWTFNQTLSVGSGNKIKTTVIEGTSTRTLYKTPIKNLRESLLSYMGISYESVQLTNDFLCVSKDVDVTALTFGTFLRMICELNCCFPHFDRNNMLEFIVLDVESTASRYDTAEITGIQFLNSDGEVKYVVGEKTNVYSVSQDNILILNFGTDDLTLAGNNMLEYISDLSYNPCDIKMIVGDLQYELGDRVTTEQGTHFVLQNSYSGAQFVEQEIRCEGSELVKESSRTLDTSLLVLNQKIAKVVVSVEEFETEFTEYKTETDGTLSSLSSRITQNSNSISAEVTRATTAEGSLSSSIQLTADAITAEVTRATTAEGTLSSSITQTANAITSEVTRATNAESSLSSTISQQAGEIALKVNSSDYTHAKIVAKINDNTSTVQISADKINLSGYVTLTSLQNQQSTTFIDGGNIKTGTISADKVTIDYVVPGGYMSLDSYGFHIYNVYKQNTYESKIMPAGNTGSAASSISINTNRLYINERNSSTTAHDGEIYVGEVHASHVNTGSLWFNRLNDGFNTYYPATGSFTDKDNQTITVENGIIVSIGGSVF